MELYLHRFAVRKELSYKYLSGVGIEIGALHSPLPVNPNTIVKYVDRFDVKTLREHYPELEKAHLVNVDIIDDGEILSKVNINSQDFVIANHFLEHSENTILTFENLLRVIRKGGVLYLAIPNKEKTFDFDRESTTIEHALDEYENGSDKNTEMHYDDFIRNACKIEDENEIKAKLYDLMSKKWSIHFHVWNVREIIDFVIYLKEKLNFEFDIEEISECYDEVVFILRKNKMFPDLRIKNIENKALEAFQNKSPSARKNYEHLLMYEPTNLVYLYQIALICMYQSNFDEAIDYLSKCIEIDSTNKDFYYKLAYCLRELGELEEAEEIEGIIANLN